MQGQTSFTTRPEHVFTTHIYSRTFNRIKFNRTAYIQELLFRVLQYFPSQRLKMSEMK